MTQRRSAVAYCAAGRRNFPCCSTPRLLHHTTQASIFHCMSSIYTSHAPLFQNGGGSEKKLRGGLTRRRRGASQSTARQCASATKNGAIIVKPFAQAFRAALINEVLQVACR